MVPQGELCLLVVKLSPGGEDPLFAPPFFNMNSTEYSPLGVIEGLIIPPEVKGYPWGPSLPVGANWPLAFGGFDRA